MISIIYRCRNTNINTIIKNKLNIQSLMTQVQQKLVSMWKELLILNVQYLAHNYMFQKKKKTFKGKNRYIFGTIKPELFPIRKFLILSLRANLMHNIPWPRFTCEYIQPINLAFSLLIWACFFQVSFVQKSWAKKHMLFVCLNKYFNNSQVYWRHIVINQISTKPSLLQKHLTNHP